MAAVGGRSPPGAIHAPDLTGAVDAQDLDADGVRDGEASAVPNIQSRIGYSHATANGRRLTIAAAGYFARETLSAAIGGRTDITCAAIGMDYEVPFGRRVTLRGELWTGRNLADIRGGIGQSINRSTGANIASRGGWTEIGVNLTPRHSAFVGYTLDAPEEADVSINGRTRNGAWFVTGRWTPARAFTLGVDYLHWTTKYKGLPEGVDNRVNAYAVYQF